jgi:hypothetical protein
MVDPGHLEGLVGVGENLLHSRKTLNHPCLSLQALHHLTALH